MLVGEACSCGVLLWQEHALPKPQQGAHNAKKRKGKRALPRRVKGAPSVVPCWQGHTSPWSCENHRWRRG